MALRIESVSAPLDEPELLRAAARLVLKVRAMGLLPRQTIRRLDLEALRAIFAVLAANNLAVSSSVRALGSEALDPARLRELIRQTSEVLDETPVPSAEWGAVSDVLADDTMRRLMHLSLSSLRRYRSGERGTPPEVAQRLHFLALLVGDLAGAYNEIGIRAWFSRRRVPLGDRSPAQILAKAWGPEDEGPARLRALAEALTGSPAT